MHLHIEFGRISNLFSTQTKHWFNFFAIMEGPFYTEVNETNNSNYYKEFIYIIRLMV